MTPELQILLGSMVGGAGALLSYWAGWRDRGRVIVISGRIGRRGSNPPPPGCKPQPPQGPPLTEGRTTRGNGHGGPTTPKPQFPPPRTIPGDMP